MGGTNVTLEHLELKRLTMVPGDPLHQDVLRNVARLLSRVSILLGRKHVLEESLHPEKRCLSGPRRMLNSSLCSNIIRHSKLELGCEDGSLCVDRRRGTNTWP
jgi:hypothetical protein